MPHTLHTTHCTLHTTHYTPHPTPGPYQMRTHNGLYQMLNPLQVKRLEEVERERDEALDQVLNPQPYTLHPPP